MMATLIQILLLALVLALLGVLAFLVRDVLKKMSGSGLILLGGLLVLFLGERMLGVTDWRLPVSLMGALIVLTSFGLRAWALSRSQGDRAAAHRQALGWTGLVLVGLALYALTLDAVVFGLGFNEDSAVRWRGVWTSLFPIVVLLGLAPVFMLDRVLAAHPRVLPAGAGKRATLSGLVAALAIALVFPLNYLANAHNQTWDARYFRTTSPGTSTKALVSTLTEPVEAVLFFTPGSDVGREVQPYFQELQSASQGLFTVRQVDQALDPAFSEELKIRDNGYIVFKKGETVEKIKVGTELDRAKRELRKLDRTVQEHLVKVTRGQRMVYLLAGHGEASSRERDDPLRRLNLFKTELLGMQNLKSKDFGVADGSTSQVPEDAALVVVAAPEKALAPEEVEVLGQYFDDGGSLLVLVDPASDKLPDLLARLGVTAGEHPLAHEAVFLNQRRGIADRVLLATNRYGSHDITRTLARNSTQLGLILPTAVSVEKAAETSHKVTTLVKSFPDTWADANGDRQPSEGEERREYSLAVAVQAAQGDGRAVVIGDVSIFADTVLGYSQGNALFAVDALRWLVGDEAITGDVQSEEDVKIVHTRDEDQVWFYATTFAVPLLVVGFGVILIQIRRRKS